jgi:hypothetical protein
LTKHDVEFLVVGGYAVAFHAKPRFTKDIDIWVRRTTKNATSLLAALDEFGFGGLGLTVEDFTKEGSIIQLGVAPNRIDLLTSVSGLDFDAAWENRALGKFGERDVPYISKEDLIANKESVGRPQDALDVAWLRRAK